MEEIGIKPHLWLQQIGSGSFIKPATPYVMSDDKKKFSCRLSKN